MIANSRCIACNLSKKEEKIRKHSDEKKKKEFIQKVTGILYKYGDTDAADHYFKRLTRITLLISSAWNLLIFLLTPFFMKFYALQPETKRLVIWLVLIHNVFNAAAYPFSGALSNGLRAAGDVKFTMYVSVISTIAVRLLLSWLLGIVLKMGVIGIAIAMVCDWSIRAVIFFWRQKSGKWKTFQVI